MSSLVPLALLLHLACAPVPPPAPATTPYDEALAAWLAAPGFQAPAAAAALAAADPAGRALPLLVARFTARGWGTVHRAQEALVAYGDRAVPALIALLDDERKEKLEETADLIYPGADEFYGHGYVLEYDLDWIPTRAGWPLQEITKVAFGFTDEAAGWPSDQTDEARAAQRRAAVAKAKAWWAARPR